MTETQQKCVERAIEIGRALHKEANVLASGRGSTEPAEVAGIMAALATLYAAQPGASS